MELETHWLIMGFSDIGLHSEKETSGDRSQVGLNSQDKGPQIGVNQKTVRAFSG